MKRPLVTFLLLLLVAGLVDLARFSHDISDSSPGGTPEEAVDVIAVLTGGQGRFKEAFTLLTQGKGRVLFISGIEPGVQLADIFKANKIQRNAELFKGRIYLGDESRSTAENAIEVKKIMSWLHATSVLLVTSTYHMSRARQLMETELQKEPAIEAELYDLPVESPNFVRDSWWKSLTGWEILLSEYLKSRALMFGFSGHLDSKKP